MRTSTHGRTRGPTTSIAPTKRATFPSVHAIDWASCPYGQNAFKRKPSAVIGTSPGAIGTAVAQQQLRSVLSFCNSPQMNSPEAYIQYKDGLIDDEDRVTVESTADFLRKYMEEFQGFVERVLTLMPRAARA